jgi:CHAD domain-containing protein
VPTAERFLEGLLRRVTRDLGVAAGSGAEEAVHRLRVELKRLHAFLRLVEWLNPKYDSSASFRPFHRLFKSAAPLRDLHVRMEAARRLSSEMGLELCEYRNFQKIREGRARRRFSRVAARFPDSEFRFLSESVHRALDRIGEDYVRYRTEKFSDRLLGDLASYADRPGLRAADYHEIRVYAKEARYVGEVLSQGEAPVPEVTAADPLLRRLHQALGRWHDALVGGKSLQEFLRRPGRRDLFDPHSYDLLSARLSRDAEQSLSVFRSEWAEFREFAHRRGSRAGFGRRASGGGPVPRITKNSQV